jgi:GNAT superfamily N-acetyltransferase
MLSDLQLASRLERAEGYACAQFAEARQRLVPGSSSEWMEFAGGFVVFDGPDSPVTQTFALGLAEELSEDTLSAVEHFYEDRGAPVSLEICPLAGVPALNLLCVRKYRPIEISNVVYRPVERPEDRTERDVAVRVAGPEEIGIWAETGAKGWAHEHPELFDFVLESGAVASARQGSSCFIAELDGQPAAAGVLCIHEGVALFGGSATVPEFRRRGVQTALISERMRYAHEYGCDVAMMVAEAGSNSQRNAERKGFHIAYTRIKWQLSGKSDKT